MERLIRQAILPCRCLPEWPRTLAALLVAGLLLAPSVARAQLGESIFRAGNGQVYQVLQHRNSANAGTGVENIRITSVIASAASAIVPCSFAGVIGSQDAEAVVTVPQGQAFPLNKIFKSNRIADATAPCFNPSGNGTVCIGPGCGPSPTCACSSNCTTFTISGGTAIATGTADVPAAALLTPFNVTGPHCSLSNSALYVFGAGGPTLQATLCATEPGDGFLLPSATTVFSGGHNGTSIVLAYDVGTVTGFNLGAAGFQIDMDGNNTLGCTGTDRILGASAANDTAPPPPAPPQHQCVGVTGVLRSFPRR